MDGQVYIPEGHYIYRAEHRIMEGDCEYDHGPRMVRVPALFVDR